MENSPVKKKHGGRQKGTPNKTTQSIEELCQKHNFHPIENLILIAKNDWQALGYDSGKVERFGFGGQTIYEDLISIELRLSASYKVAEFVHPKRKAVEISNSDEISKGFVLAYSNEGVKKAASGTKD